MPTNNPTLCILPDAERIAAAAAEICLSAALQAVRSRGRFMLALAGGSTPRRLYERLAGRAGEDSRQLAGQFPWSQTHVFFGDERYVPHDHPDSNCRMARESLLDHAPIPPAQIHPIPTTAADPAEAARKYAADLSRAFGIAAADVPVFDLILLGMGPDGHTASLFPGTAAVRENRLLVAAPWVEKFSTHRVTLTPPVLWAAAEVMMLVAGTDKATALAKVLQGPADVDHWPAQVLRHCQGQVTWLVDQAAAAKLAPPPAPEPRPE